MLALTPGFSTALQGFADLPIATTAGAHPIKDGAGLADFMAKNGPGSQIKKGVGGMLKDYLDPHTFAHPGEGGSTGGTQVAEDNKPNGFAQVAKQVAAKTQAKGAPQPTQQKAPAVKPTMTIE